MEAYRNFASVYDTFMSDIPYDEWHTYLLMLLKKQGIEEGTVLELGCGTGTMTELLAESGYDMIGLDLSEDMLAIANEKKMESGHDILYLNQDMTELELYSTVNAVVSICDSMNYILESEDLVETFRRVGEYLEEDGVFIFDFKTEYFYKNVLGDQTIAENRDECSFIWDNYYYEEEKINEYELSIFVKDEELSKGEEIFRRYQETHFQRGYIKEEMFALLEKAGLQVLHCYDAFTEEPARGDSERVYIIAGKGDR